MNNNLPNLQLPEEKIENADPAKLAHRYNRICSLYDRFNKEKAAEKELKKRRKLKKQVKKQKKHH